MLADSCNVGAFEQGKRVIKHSKFATELKPPPARLVPWEEYRQLYDTRLMKKANHVIKRVKAWERLLYATNDTVNLFWSLFHILLERMFVLAQWEAMLTQI